MKTLGELKAESKVETLLRKRERSEEERLYQDIQKEREKVLSKKREWASAIKSPGYFIANQLDKTKSGKALLVRMKKPRPDIPSDSRLLFVVKIQPSVNAANPIKTALRKLRLEERFTGVFVKSDAAVHLLLKQAEPYLAFGEPQPSLVEKLIRRRGRVLDKGVEVELKDNLLVEEKLEQFGIICIEDIIHEVTHTTDVFDAASKFLCPFRMNPPQTKFKRTAYSRGGSYGHRGDAMNQLIEGMT